MNGEASAEVGAAAGVAAEGSDMKEQPRGHEKQWTSLKSSLAGTAKRKNRNLRILNFNLTHRFPFSSIVPFSSSPFHFYCFLCFSSIDSLSYIQYI